MATRTRTGPVSTHDTGAAAGTAPEQWVHAAGCILLGIADAFSDYCRRVRAYNELANLTPQALQDIGRRPDELDRVIAGEVPLREA